MTLDSAPRHNTSKASYERNKTEYLAALSSFSASLQEEISRIQNNLSPNPCLLEDNLPRFLPASRRFREQNLIIRSIDNNPTAAQESQASRRK